MPPCCLVFPLTLLSLLFSVIHFPPPLLLDPPLFLFNSFYSDSIYFDIYLSFSFPLCSFFAATPPLICSLCACFASSPPSLLAPSHLRHTHLALPFIASGGWRATVSFNPSQCHLQTLTQSHSDSIVVSLSKLQRYQRLDGRNHSSRTAD